MTNPYRLLITSAGSSTATNIIRALASDERFEIHTADINPDYMLAVKHLGSISHIVVPLANEGMTYAAAIREYATENSIDFIYPVHDSEIITLLEAEQSIGGLHLPNNTLQSINDCSDKLVAAEICLKNGIPAPKTRKGGVEGIALPAFVKPRRGVGSHGAFLLKDMRDAPIFWDDLVVQEVCERPEVTVDALFARDGSTIAVARERIEVKAGVCVKARVYYDVELSRIANAISKAFRLTGLVCFQVMRGPSGWLVTDINPRCGGGTSLTRTAGVDLYKAYFTEVAGFSDASLIFSEVSERAHKLQETIVVRYYDEVACVRVAP